MCGIAGIIAATQSVDELHSRLTAMQARLSHRGPDDLGILFPEPHVGLGHTRLSILDLSPGGHQPMQFADGRFTIVFNGEIYNFRKLRSELKSEGVSFRSHSDTEVILALYARDGVACLPRLEGMFAFAIWDRLDKSLVLARDTFGIKPLYLWKLEGNLAFSSEFRSVLQAELGPKTLDASACFGYFRLGSVPEPLTLVNGVRMLPAGHWQKWKDGEISSPQRFDALHFESPIQDQSTAVRTVRHALEESIERHFVSDVPVGLFLSGGVDSSALLALGRKNREQLRTFCIRFDNPEFDEGDLARRTAHHFGADHTEWQMSSSDGMALAADYLKSIDLPTCDGFNTFCVASLAARNEFKVVLSGLGGDELFGGYPSFQKIPFLLKTGSALSNFGLRSIGATILERMGRQQKWKRLAEFLRGENSVANAWLAMRGHFTTLESLQLTAKLFDGEDAQWKSCAVQQLEDDLRACLPGGDIKDEVSAIELQWYMRNQLLRDSDVMSMRWGLELRVPFVDVPLFRSVSQICSRLRLAEGKQLLKAAVPELPEWVINQPKRGFRFPFEEWATQCWSDWFQRVGTSPVQCSTWYQKWSLIALQHVLDANGIRATERLVD